MSIKKLRDFVVGMTRLIEAHGNTEAAVMATTHDIHAVSNALPDRASISIHLYGGDIGAVSRHVFDPETGPAETFISGYSGDVVPNLWPAPG